MSENWTDTRVELLKKLWGEGLSASQIATELGEVTRNAVIGKIHRLGLSGRVKISAHTRPPKAAKPKRETTPRSVARASRPVDEVAETLPPAEEMTASGAQNLVGFSGLLQLTESTCRWVTGDVGQEFFYFCGDRTKPGRPYCAYHARIAYQPVSDRKKDLRLAYA